MPYSVALYFAIFIVATAVHLLSGHIDKGSLGGPTKVIILPAILGFYLEWVHWQGITPSAFLVFALVTSWIGDILLIPGNIRWFTAGGISFWISHFLFIFAYIESGIRFSLINPLWAGLIAMTYACVVIGIFKRLRPDLPKSLYYPMFFYLLTNEAMNVFAWLRLLSGSCSLPGGIVTGLGALAFFASDSLLFIIRFDHRNPIRQRFLIMLTYSLGEFLIVFGLTLLRG